MLKHLFLVDAYKKICYIFGMNFIERRNKERRLKKYQYQEESQISEKIRDILGAVAIVLLAMTICYAWGHFYAKRECRKIGYTGERAGVGLTFSLHCAPGISLDEARKLYEAEKIQKPDVIAESPIKVAPIPYRRMINQIKNAPKQIISTSYISGADDNNTTSLVWNMDDSGLWLFVRVSRILDEYDRDGIIANRAGEILHERGWVDTNFDGQPDATSALGQPAVAISSSDQNYKEIISEWEYTNAYFTSKLLK